MVEAMFPPGTVMTYAAGDAEDLARAILRLVDSADDREARVAATGVIVREVAWERESVRYLDLVERLARDGISSPAAGDAGPPADTEAP